MTLSAPSLPALSRRLGLGKLAYKLVYAPRGFVKTTWQRGPLNRYLSYRGQRQMEAQVGQLRPLAADADRPSYDIYFMTGRKYWYQTCFCAYSMQQQSPVNLRPVVYDDGSLQPDQKAEILRIFPQGEIVAPAAVEARLERVLPEAEFPCLRSHRLQQPLIRKLIDFHAGETGWKLFLDSDMVFFRQPQFLLDWLAQPQAPCYMVDVKNAYGYSETLLQELADGPLPQKVNIGIFGLQSEAIDWHQIEAWLQTFLAQEGSHYNVTQGLSCLYLAGRDCAIAPATDYRLLPDRQEAQRPQAVMHHYVAESKPWYFRYGWRHVARG
ncbi:hypothetical protein [Nodosilinea nodulosa]|uniref:hypothetical protein n=1 Tax=Nodosilinea nodulosa TaxID=416001 RepID=UPI000300E912|nr:hypothetical protein [Nodosilinea nodulosa]